MTKTGTIFISGAGRGLGRAMALHLAGMGTRLLLHYGSSGEGARETAREAEDKGAEVVLLQADLADIEARARLMKQAAEAGDGRLRLMINNASVYPEAGLLETTPEQWNRTMEINCNAVFHLTTLALPMLRAATPSRVINLGDSGADRVMAKVEAVPYHAAKLGVHLLTRSFAKALTGEGITVNMISPGFLENSVGEAPSSIPAGRTGRFEDVLGALDYLVSDRAAYVSGANIIVSGGWNI